jgi:hypothetical protein
MSFLRYQNLNVHLDVFCFVQSANPSRARVNMHFKPIVLYLVPTDRWTADALEHKLDIDEANRPKLDCCRQEFVGCSRF